MSSRITWTNIKWVTNLRTACEQIIQAGFVNQIQTYFTLYCKYCKVMLQAGFKLTTTTDTQLFVYHYPISLVDGILPCCLPSCFPALSTPPPLSSWSQRKAEVINHRQMVEGNGTRAQYGHNAHNYSSLNRCTENTAGHHYIITLWVRPRRIHVEMTQHFLTSNGTNDEW